MHQLAVVGGNMRHVKVSWKTKLQSHLKEVMLGKKAKHHGSINGKKPTGKGKERKF
jgi:hypothetical protein